ncbi:MAG: hypothetical protein KA419_06930 [Acidobacteria bacterium]|nr:hypothetical protein [Acidobacteriota bacterium]
MIRYGVTLLMLLFCCNPVASQCSGKNYLSSILESSGDQRQKAISELYSKGKESIPVLMECIDNSEAVEMGLDNPFSSNVFPNSPVYKGLIAAYLIELILGCSEIKLMPFSEPSNSLICGGPMSYPYENGRIFDTVKRRPIVVRDLAIIKNIYKKWWFNNETKSLDELRTEWGQGQRPLTKSRYTWK